MHQLCGRTCELREGTQLHHLSSRYVLTHEASEGSGKDMHRVFGRTLLDHGAIKMSELSVRALQWKGQCQLHCLSERNMES